MRERDHAALFAYLEQRGPMPYAWGRRANDCFSFLEGAVRAQLGRGFLGKLKWSSPTSAMMVVKRAGGVEAFYDARFDRIAPALARRGDIGAIADPVLGMHPMLVEGATLSSPGPRGLQRCPRTMMIAAWNIEKRVDGRAPAKSAAVERAAGRKDATR